MGSPSATVLSFWGTLTTRCLSVTTRKSISGTSCMLPVPKAISTKGYCFSSFSAMPGSWTIHPHTPISICGRSLRTSFSQVTLPRALRSALSLMQQVLCITRSASRLSPAGRIPMLSRIPASFSESWAFIWQP